MSFLAATKAHDKFYAQIYAAVVRHFDLNELKVVIIASPGFTKDSVYAYLIEEAVVRSNFFFPSLFLPTFPFFSFLASIVGKGTHLFCNVFWYG